MTYAERIAKEMRELPIAERNRRIVYGVLAGKVIDARERFRVLRPWFEGDVA